MYDLGGFYSMREVRKISCQGRRPHKMFSSRIEIYIRKLQRAARFHFLSGYGILWAFGEVLHELNASHTWELSECKPTAPHEVSGHGIISIEIIPRRFVSVRRRDSFPIKSCASPGGVECPEDII